MRKNIPFFHFKISIVKSDDKRQKRELVIQIHETVLHRIITVLPPDECEYFATNFSASSELRY